MADIHIREGAPDHRFSRFELITWWEQSRLAKAKVLVIGAGALGNEIVKNCALLGIGNILVADMDRIEKSNLTRSVLFREKDEGRYKSEVACEAARGIFPQIKAHHFIGNVVHDLGLGVYEWADVIMGGLDNREARVAINSGSMFTGKTWIDGAIEVLDGVARVFSPGDGPCYECTMSAVDWKMLEARRSCALLTREQLNDGKVPTTPTTGSIIAAMQVQEMLKLLHGMPVMAGKGFIFNGLSSDTYVTAYTRKKDCYAHERYARLERLKAGVADMKVKDLLALARKTLGEDASIQLSRDIITGLTCVKCNKTEAVYRSLGKVTEREGKCPDCGQMRAPETAASLGHDDSVFDLTFKALGVPPFDIVTARCGEESVSYLFDGDGPEVLGALAN